MLYAFVDASWADDFTTRKSAKGILPDVGNKLVDWSSKLQIIFAHSTTETEYAAVDSATRMVM